MRQPLLLIFVFVILTENNVISFSPSAKVVQVTRLQETNPGGVVTDEPIASIMEEPKITVSELPQMSTSIPFLKRPPMLTGVLAGDVGFDPLGFAKTQEDLMNYREAEIKHARLAMLAAAGWPLSEIFDKKIANFLGLTPLLDNSDRVPSLLNGGLEKVSPFYWTACVVIAAAVDIYGLTRKSASSQDYVPGDLGLDFFGLYPNTDDGRKRMQLAEIKNGRLAMIAIVAFAFQEALTKIAVVNETPLFFFPL